MSSITITATLQPDGVTLRLDGKVALPSGPVTVTIQPATPQTGPGMLEVLERVHEEQRRRGRRAMTEDEMAAEIAAMRKEEDEVS